MAKIIYFQVIGPNKLILLYDDGSLAESTYFTVENHVVLGETNQITIPAVADAPVIEIPIIEEA